MLCEIFVVAKRRLTSEIKFVPNPVLNLTRISSCFQPFWLSSGDAVNKGSCAKIDDTKKTRMILIAMVLRIFMNSPFY
jgi:hypothetical protein